MNRKSICMQKECEGEWYVWNPNNSKSAKIIKFQDQFPLLGKVSNRYRVDVGGITVKSMIDKFQTARKIAYEKVKND